MLALAVTAITCSTETAVSFQISILYGRSSRAAGMPPEASFFGLLSSASPEVTRRSRLPVGNGEIRPTSARALDKGIIGFVHSSGAFGLVPASPLAMPCLPSHYQAYRVI